MEIFGHTIDLSPGNQAIAVRLGEFLIEENLIRPDDLKHALDIQAEEQRDAGLSMGALLTKYTDMDTDQLDALLQHPGLQKTMISLSLSAGLLNPGQIETCLRLKPVGESLGRVLRRRYPEAREQLDALMTTLPVLGNLALSSGLISEQELTRINGISSGRRSLADVFTDLNLSDRDTLTRICERHTPELIAERAVNILLDEASAKGAHTIHLDPDEQGIQLRLRLGDGFRQVRLDQPADRAPQTALALVRRIKRLTGLPEQAGHLPCNGTLNLTVETAESPTGRTIKGHVAVCPTRCGQSVTLHLTQACGYAANLEDLPYSPGIAADFKKLLRKRHGVVLVCGPPGSDKGKTLYAALRHLRHPDLKLFTAENPVAHPMTGVNQARAAPEQGLTRARLVRAIARHQDADVILVDHLDNGFTIEAAFEAAEQGHLVIGALAARDTVDALERLMDLGMARERISGALAGILAQRKLPRICKACKQLCPPAPHERRMLFDSIPEQTEFYTGAGCPVCGRSGLHGTTLIAEVLDFAPRTASAFRNETDTGALSTFLKIHGLRTMLQDGLAKTEQVRLADLLGAVPPAMVRGFAGKEKPPAFEVVEPALPNLLQIEERASLALPCPMAQEEAIDQLFFSYQAMRQNAGQVPVAADAVLFRRFILQSVREVKIKYACQTVRIELIGSDEGVQIMAVPVWA